MAPDPDDDRSTGESAPGDDPGFDEAALYSVVRAAVEDAILGVLGTLVLVGLAFVVVWVGAGAAVDAASPAGVALGAGIVVVGFYIAAATLEVVPPVREWF